MADDFFFSIEIIFSDAFLAARIAFTAQTGSLSRPTRKVTSQSSGRFARKPRSEHKPPKSCRQEMWRSSRLERTHLEIERVIRPVGNIISHPPATSGLIQQRHKQQLTRAHSKSLSLSHSSSSPTQSSLNKNCSLSPSLPSPHLSSPDNLNPFKPSMKGDG